MLMPFSDADLGSWTHAKGDLVAQRNCALTYGFEVCVDRWVTADVSVSEIIDESMKILDTSMQGAMVEPCPGVPQVRAFCRPVNSGRFAVTPRFSSCTAGV